MNQFDIFYEIKKSFVWLSNGIILFWFSWWLKNMLNRIYLKRQLIDELKHNRTKMDKIIDRLRKNIENGKNGYSFDYRLDRFYLFITSVFDKIQKEGEIYRIVDKRILSPLLMIINDQKKYQNKLDKDFWEYKKLKDIEYRKKVNPEAVNESFDIISTKKK